MKSIAIRTGKSAGSPRMVLSLAAFLCLSTIISGCDTTPTKDTSSFKAADAGNSGTAEEFYIVDCLLPGQVRQLGGRQNYVTQRRPIKTSQSDCEIRGGEYVAYDRADYSTALRIWLPLAKAGDANAQTYVGEIYEKGLGLTADYPLAAHWYAEAVKQGYSRAQINLGNLYEKGLGVPQDKQQALNLYRSASGLGADHLLYASTLSTNYVPRQQHAKVQNQLAAEQQHSEQLRRKLGRVSSDLKQQSTELTTAESQLQATQGELEQVIEAQSRANPASSSEPTSGKERELLASVQTMEGYQDDLESQLEQLRRQNSDLNHSQQALVEQLSGNERARSEYQTRVAQLERELSESRDRVELSERELASASEKMAQQQSRETALKPELASLQRELEAGNEALTAERVNQARLQSEREALAEQLAASDKQIESYQARLDGMQQKMAQEQQRMLQSEREIAALEAQLGEQHSRDSTSSSAMAALQREVELKDSALVEQRRIYSLMAEEKQALELEITASDRRRAGYEEQVAGLQQELSSTTQALAGSRAEVSALAAQLTQMQQRDSSLSPQFQQLQRELEEKNRALADESIKLAGLESQSLSQQQLLADTVADLERTSARLASMDSSYAREKASLDAMLSEREGELEEIRHQLLLSRASMQMERAANEKTIAQQSRAHQEALSAQESELKQLTSQVASQYEMVQSQKAEIARLQSQASSYQRELADTESAGQAPANVQVAALTGDGPAIEIIEPPVVLTRSQATVRLRTFRGERQVIGKVSAPSGLLSLSVNGETPTLTDNNLFRSSIPLTEDPTPVEVVLVDNEGRRAAVSFSFIDQQESSNGGTSPPIIATTHFDTPGKFSNVPMGDYHALVIGNNAYRNFSTLATAVNDARETEKLLRDKYHFKTRLLLNADRYTILSALDELRESLDENDNLLIYYAGHGKLDESNDLGYWLPVDADQDNSINWISNKAITDILNLIQAKHILVVADSCYAGTLTQTPIARVQTDIPDDVREEWIRVMAETKARITLTSGGVEPVLDGGGGQHSVFAKAFLGALRSNKGVLEGYTLYSRVLEVMASQASPLGQAQVPQYAPIHLAGHESGEFFFKPG